MPSPCALFNDSYHASVLPPHNFSNLGFLF